VLPVAAGHHAWADAVESLVNDPARYARLSAAAVARARSELNWSAWAAGAVALMREAVGADAAAGTISPASLAG
jgi:glycosyltransferase involved in cell wall biosynthesis